MSSDLSLRISPRPSRIAAILANKLRLANDAGGMLGRAEVRERMLREELEQQDPTLPEEGEVGSEVAELEGILRDTHSRYLLCAKSVKAALTQANNIDATTVDHEVRRDTRANLLELREKLAELKRERSRAETNLRNHEDFPDFYSLIALLLEAERETAFLSEVLDEQRAENELVEDVLKDYGLHTHLTLSRKVHYPRVPAADDGRRCEMCNQGFPAKEVLISPCGHFYHIFCLAIRVAVYKDCCRQTCREPFPPCWLRNFGFPSIVQTETESETTSAGSSSEDGSRNGAIRCLLFSCT